MRNPLFRLALACVFAATGVQAAEPVDSTTFYDERPTQAFKGMHPEPVQIGFEEGNDTPFLTWKGKVSGKDFYLELHGSEVKIITERHTVSRSLENSFRLPGEVPTELDSRGVDLYVSSNARKSVQSVLCIESLEPGVSRPKPFRSAYVILDPLGDVRIYKIPRRLASCKGVTRSQVDGDFFVPEWRFDDSAAQTFTLRYNRLGRKGLVRDTESFSGRTVPSGEDLFLFDNAPQ